MHADKKKRIQETRAEKITLSEARPASRKPDNEKDSFHPNMCVAITNTLPRTRAR